MAHLLQSATEVTDPRILRSRRMLMNALAGLLKKKEFEHISVQEIADKATLNRNTFYLHYADKAALLQSMTEFRFRNLLERRGVSFTDCNGALRTIALGVCDYLTELTNCSVKGASIPLEGSLIPVIEGMLLEGAAHHAPAPGPGNDPGSDQALMATTAAWGIFGAARRWHQTPNRIPAEEMAARIEAIVKPVFLGSLESLKPQT